MSKVLAITAAVVGIAALVLTGVGIFMAPAAFAAFTASIGGITASMLSVAAGALAIGSSLLAPRPKAPSMSAGTLDRLHLSLNPNAFRTAVFGNTAFATDIGDNEANDVAGTEDDQEVHRWVICAAHKVNSIKEIWFDNELVWTLAGGVIAKYATTDGAPYLEVTVRTEGTSGNYINAGSRITPSTRRYTGCAYVYFHFYLNSTSPFSQGIPTRCTIIGEGMPVYDPRKDSTVTGGSGTQRANDQTTWSYSVSGNLAGENPALQLMTWLLGWRIGGKVSVGKGIPADRIDWPAVITAANVCDESQSLSGGGTSKRYVAGGIVTEGDDTLAAVDRWKAAMNAIMDDVDGQIRIQCLVNDLGVPIADFTEDDIIDDAQYTMSSNLVADYNIIRGSFVNPATNVLFQLAEYPDITLASRDGIDRLETVNYDMVQSQAQAQRLSKQRLQRAQFPGVFTANYKITAWKVQKGDIVRQTFGPFGMNLKLFRVIDLKHTWSGVVPLTLREENALTYAWDNEDSPVVVYAPATNYSNADTPWQRMMKGQWTPPSATSGGDANMLSDVTFGSRWIKTATFRREWARKTSASFPFPAELFYVGEVTMSATGGTRSATNRDSLRITEGRMYYFRVQIARSVGATGSPNITMSCVFKNAAGGTVAGGLNQAFAANTITNDGQYYEKVFAVIAPAGAAKIESFAISVATGGSGTLRFCKPWVSDKEPGADVSLVISGPAVDTVQYDYTGAVQAGELPRDFEYVLSQAGVPITTGITWTYQVIAGTVNTFTAASGVKSMTGAGTGVLTVSSLGSQYAEVDIYASYNGKPIGPYRLRLDKVTAAAPTSGGGGSGGGASSQSSGFTSYNSTTFIATSAELSYEMPAGKTTAILSANLSAKPDRLGNQSTWTNQGKWQRETSPGTWTDVTASIATGTSSVDEVDTPQGIKLIASPAELVLSVNATGLTAGSTYKFRFMARLTAAPTNTHTVTGTVSVTS